MKSSEFIEKKPELFKKAQECKSLDEFLNLAKKNNIKFEDISLEEAYDLLNGKQEISDDLLDNVAGGKAKKTSDENKEVETCKYTRLNSQQQIDAYRNLGYPIVQNDGGDYFLKEPI